MRPRFRVLADSVGPGAGSVVMATGIVSVSLVIDGQSVLSRVLLGLGLAVWAVLAVVFAWRALYDRARFASEGSSPAGLTAVAATAVLGSRFLDLGWPGPAAAMLILAAGLWLGMVGLVWRAMPTRVTGSLFMLTVSTQGLAVLSAALAASDHAPFLEYLALPLCVGGLVLYVEVLRRFDVRQLLDGAGDHWICGGALAISTLAAAQITLTAARIHMLGGASAVLDDFTLALWAAALAWLPALVVAEVLSPRLRYDRRRWSTVFPVGMYAVCTFTVATATGIKGLNHLARVWTWVALAVWAATAVGLIGRLRLGPHDYPPAESFPSGNA